LITAKAGWIASICRHGLREIVFRLVFSIHLASSQPVLLPSMLQFNLALHHHFVRLPTTRGCMKYDWFDISKENKFKWERICPPGEYRIVPASVLSSVLPEALISKYNSVFIAGPATLDGKVYYMANGNCVDTSKSAVLTLMVEDRTIYRSPQG